MNVKKRLVVGLAVVVVSVFVCCRFTSAHGGRHGTEPVRLKDPKLGDLANRPDRVDGYWVNGHDCFYFAGKTKVLNDFLHRYGQLKETPLVLVIHPGKAPVEKAQGKLSYDWRLDVLDPAAPSNQDIFCKPGGGQWPRVVTVQTWLGGNIRLNELKAPGNMKVRPGGEIGAFIERHNKQERVRARGKGDRKGEGPEAGRVAELQAQIRTLSCELAKTQELLKYHQTLTDELLKRPGRHEHENKKRTDSKLRTLELYCESSKDV